MYIMLTQEQSQRFAIEEQTSTDNILKEHYQIYILDILFSAPFSSSLAFKGGTALKLVYNSFRFSEDLDFSIINTIDFAKFKKTIQKIPNIIPESKINEVYEKKYTLFAKLTFNIDFKPIPIGVKVEINKGKKEFEYTPSLIRSRFNNLEVIGNTYTLKQILKDKKLTLKERREPRDLFDTWYISQKLGVAYNVSKEIKYTRKELMDKLNPYLPKKQRNVLNLFEK
ncbi:nucleotidyl transferase AbiEii/AbiGii toxin family protein [Patescibacteria group bacterium]|nr:nucleotidyl transferase AbiEii/AbiGii toxin family protein [Patescibacteria group bacterium]